MRETGERLGLSGVEYIHARAEEAPEAFRESFDVATSRAVAKLNVLCELCLPLVRPGGVFAAMKGPDCQEEIEQAANALKALGARYEKTYSYEIPGTDIVHSVVIIRKTGNTNAKYPRRWAQIKGRPL